MMAMRKSAAAIFGALLLCAAFSAGVLATASESGNVIISNEITPLYDVIYLPDPDEPPMGSPIPDDNRVPGLFTFSYYNNATQWTATVIDARMVWWGSTAQSPAYGTITLLEDGIPVATETVDQQNQVLLSWTPTMPGMRPLQMAYSPSSRPDEPLVESFSADFQINVIPAARNISEFLLTFTGANQFVYTGEAHWPAVALSIPGSNTLLTPGTDYTVSYLNEIDAGFGTATVTGVGEYTGKIERQFLIDRAETQIELWPEGVYTDYCVARVDRLDPYTGHLVPVYAGSVRFDFTSGIEVIPVANGLALAPKPANGQWLSAQYMGNENHLPSQVAVNDTGPKEIATSIALALSSRSETDAILVANVSPAEAGSQVMGGMVTFYADGAAIGSVALTGNIGTLVWQGVPTGMHVLTAVYQGDGLYAPSTSAPIPLNNLANGMALSAVRVDAWSVRLTAALSGSSVPPTGAIAFYMDGVSIGSVPVSGNGASLVVDGLVPGAYSFSASYSGDSNYFPRASSYSVSFHTYEPALSFSIEEYPDGSAKLVALVTGNVPGTPPQGTVLFHGDGVPAGAFAQVGPGGWAIFRWPSTPHGEFTIHAEYLGDGNYPGLVSGPQTVRNMPAVSQVSMTMSPMGGFFLKMSVQSHAPGAPEPTGLVTFTQNSVVLEEVELVRGQASCLYPVPEEGRVLRASAIYSGDINYFPREETVVIGEDLFTQREPEKTRPSVAVAATAGSGEGPATLTVTVTGRGGQFPTGQVIFSKDTEFLGVQELYRGEAVFSWEDAPQGSHTIYAEYRGDERFLGDTAVTVFRKNGHIAPLTPQDMRKNPQFVILRDRSGKNMMVYDTTRLPMHRGVMTLESKQQESFYSYGFNLGHLRDLGRRQQDGHFDIRTPGFTLRMPYSLSTQMRDLIDYIIDRDLRPSELELRLEITAASKNDSIAALYREQLGDAENTKLVQVNLRLYTLDNKQLDFFATKLAVPLELVLPEGGRTQIARYDKVLRRFIPTQLVEEEKETVMTVEHCGVYRLAKMAPLMVIGEADLSVAQTPMLLPQPQTPVLPQPQDSRSRYFIP